MSIYNIVQTLCLPLNVQIHAVSKHLFTLVPDDVTVILYKGRQIHKDSGKQLKAYLLSKDYEEEVAPYIELSERKAEYVHKLTQYLKYATLTTKKPTLKTYLQHLPTSCHRYFTDDNSYKVADDIPEWVTDFINEMETLRLIYEVH